VGFGMGDYGVFVGERTVVFGYVYLTVQNVLSMFIGVLGYSFLTRCVSQVDVGVLAGLTLLASFFQLVSDFGLGSSLAKFVSEFRGRGEDPSSYFLSTVVFRFTFAFLLSLLLFLFPDWFSAFLFKTSSYSHLVKLLSLDVLLLSIIPILSSFLLGVGELKMMACCGMASTFVRWVAIVLFLLGGFGVFGVVLGWVVGDLFSVVLYFIGVLRLRVLDGFVFNFVESISRLLRFSLPLYLASLVQFLYSYYDRAIVLAFLPLSDVGVYDVVGKVFSVLVSFTAPFSSALFPYYGSAYGRSEHDLVSSTIKRASKYSALIFTPLALGLFSTGKAVITLFAGQQYEGGYTVLSILSIFALVYSISPAFSNLLLIYGKTVTILLLSIIPVAVSLSTIPLLWLFGLNGLALMKGLSMLLSFIISLYVLSRVVEIKLDKIVLLKIFSSSVIMALAVLLIEYVYYSEFLLPLYVFVGGLVYMLSLRFLSVFDEQDILFLKQVFGVRVGLIISRVLYRNRLLS
jgi:O-antigen/teichoic acid export membrane protein